MLLDNPEADSVRGVVPAGQNPHKMWRIDTETGYMRNLLDVPGVPEPYNAPRQILPLVYWQTGHIDAIRPVTIQERNSMSGKVILPVKIDPRYSVDIDGSSDWQRAEWLVWFGGLEMVYPGSRRRPLPEIVKLVVFDFDGVMTDNRVWVDAEGHEFIAAYRSDSMGIHALRSVGIESVVLSTETDKAVEARCCKIGIEVMQGVKDKAARLKNYLAEHSIDPAQVVYVGNDINDLPCFPLVGCAVAVSDAQQEVLREADMVLSRSGGFGAVREICERILKR
jgi:N-acylneuraminate cytidylyltransferase